MDLSMGVGKREAASADVRHMRRHFLHCFLSPQLQKLLLSSGFELEQRRTELKALGPLGPTARGVFAFDGEDGGAVGRLPGFFDAQDFVRGQIEQQQAEFETLSRQVETAAIAVSLRPEALPQAQMSWFQWRPLYRLKLAAHGALDAIADYATTMLAVVLYLPVIFLWAGTLTLAAVWGWKALRWARAFFGFPTAGVPTAEVK